MQASAAEALQGSDCAGGSLYVDPNPRSQQRNSSGDRGGRGAHLP
jgi:hypothetical protein